MQIKLVRVLRTAQMKRGIGVDCSGKRWRGFATKISSQQIAARGYLGSVGLCCECRERVYDGWECIDCRLDVCDSCIILPPESGIFVVKPSSQAEWIHQKRLFFSRKKK